MNQLDRKEWRGKAGVSCHQSVDENKFVKDWSVWAFWLVIQSLFFVLILFSLGLEVWSQFFGFGVGNN